MFELRVERFMEKIQNRVKWGDLKMKIPVPLPENYTRLARIRSSLLDLKVKTASRTMAVFMQIPKLRTKRDIPLFRPVIQTFLASYVLM